MKAPSDLTVDLRDGHLYLSSGGRTVDLRVGGRRGVFRDGPVRFELLMVAYLLPAIEQFRADDPCVCGEFENGERDVALGTVARCPAHPSKTFHRGPSGDC